MDIHIDKKVAGLMIFALIVGGAIGGAVGFMAGHEEGGRGEKGGYEMGIMQGNGGAYDNQVDGETQDDNGGAPNSDQQKTGTTTVTTPAQNTQAPATTGTGAAVKTQ